MGTCYEHLRKEKTFEDYKRLSAYFRAIDEDKVEEYHNERKHKKIEEYE